MYQVTRIKSDNACKHIYQCVWYLRGPGGGGKLAGNVTVENPKEPSSIPYVVLSLKRPTPFLCFES